MTITRKILLLVVVWAALAAVPPPANAGSGAMSDEEIAMLNCGHLGVSCPPGRSWEDRSRKHHKAKAARAHRGRHSAKRQHRKACAAKRHRKACSPRPRRHSRT